MRALRHAALRTSLWAFAETWGTRLISMAVFLLMARLLAPAVFGVVALAQVYLIVLQALCEQGIPAALIQRPELEAEHKNSAFWANQVVGVALALLTLALAEPLAALYGEPRLVPVLCCYSLMPVMFSLAVVQTALAQRELRYRDLAARKTIGALAGALAAMAMALAGLGIAALVGQVLVDQAVAAIALWSISSWRPRLAFSRRHLGDLFRFGLSQMATDMVWAMSEQADRMLLGSLGAVAVGYYSVAQRMRSLMGDLLGGSTQNAILPLFARIADDRERVVRGLQTAQTTLSIIVIPVGVGLAVVAPGLIRFAIGARWAPSIVPAQIMICAQLIYWLGYFFGPVMTSLGRPEVRLRIAILRALTLMVLLVLGLRYGIAGVAAAFLISHAIFYGIELAVLRELVAFSVPRYLGALIKPCIAAAAMVVPLIKLGQILAPHHLGLALAAQLVAGAAIYAVVLTALARERVAEIAALAGQLRRQPY